MEFVNSNPELSALCLKLIDLVDGETGVQDVLTWVKQYGNQRYESGRIEWYDHGYSDGYSDGNVEGYDQGLSDGLDNTR